MATFKTYDPGRVIATFKGLRLTGFMDGTFITAARSEDAFTKHVGSEGDVCRARNRDQSGTVTVTLIQSSPTNDSLSAYATADELFGLSYGALVIKDLNGTTLCESANAWIKKLPDVEYAKDVSGRAWAFDCAVLLMNVGGELV